MQQRRVAPEHARVHRGSWLSGWVRQRRLRQRGGGGGVSTHPWGRAPGGGHSSSCLSLASSHQVEQAWSLVRWQQVASLHPPAPVAAAWARWGTRRRQMPGPGSGTECCCCWQPPHRQRRPCCSCSLLPHKVVHPALLPMRNDRPPLRGRHSKSELAVGGGGSRAGGRRQGCSHWSRLALAICAPAFA